MSDNSGSGDESYRRSDAENSEPGWPPYGEQEEMHSIQESVLGRRNHLLADDVMRLSVMLLGNSLDSRHFPMRILKQVLFPDDSTEGEVNQEVMTRGQVTRHHDAQPPTFLFSQLRQPLVFQLEDIGEQGCVYQEGDGIFHWRFGIQDLFQISNTTVRIISSPPIYPLSHPREQVIFQLCLNSDGASCNSQATSFFVVTMAGSIIHDGGRVSVTLHHHTRSIQLVRECDMSINGSDAGVRVAVCGCPNFFSPHTMRQSAKAGIVCMDIQFI